MKIRFEPISSVPEETLARNKQLLTRYPEPARANTTRLAVVGGGPSAEDHLDEIEQFVDVWAINGAWKWCQTMGVKATLFTIDPVFTEPADKAILADICDPVLAGNCTEVSVVKLDGIARGSTSATAVPHIAINLGYREVHFFGCEGSFGERTHTFKDIGGSRLLVEVGGMEFLTNPQMLMQCEVLAEMIRMAPHVFISHCGGLLEAMVADPDYDCLAGSQAIHDAMRA